jgi:hypothetical protein
MIVGDLYLSGIGASPDEADAPLVVDAYAVLASPIAVKRFEPVTGRNAQEGEFHGGVDKLKFDKRALLNVGRQTARSSALPEALGFVVGEADDHSENVSTGDYPSSG